jgi:hypothetical protein
VLAHVQAEQWGYPGHGIAVATPLVAIGFNIVFIGSGTFNFARGSLMVLGTFVASWGRSTLVWPILPLILLAIVIVPLSGKMTIDHPASEIDDASIIPTACLGGGGVPPAPGHTQGGAPTASLAQ